MTELSELRRRADHGPQGGGRWRRLAGLMALGLLLGACAGPQRAAEPVSGDVEANVLDDPRPDAGSDSPRRTAPVPAPGGGSIDEVVEGPGLTVDGERGLADEADRPGRGGRVLVRVQSIAETAVQAELPGDVSGDGVAVTLRVRNNTPSALDLSSVFVTVLDADGNAGIPALAAPASPLPDSVPARNTAEGVYLFTFPDGDRSSLEVFVGYDPAEPVLHFAGETAGFRR